MIPYELDNNPFFDELEKRKEGGNSLRPAQIVRSTAIQLFGEDVGCSDGGCVYGHMGGMHTNGGCACTKERDSFRLRQHMLRLSLLAKELATGDMVRWEGRND